MRNTITRNCSNAVAYYELHTIYIYIYIYICVREFYQARECVDLNYNTEKIDRKKVQTNWGQFALPHRILLFIYFECVHKRL